MLAFRSSLVLLALTVFCASPSSAQYMYLDSNGNGIHDQGDVMQPNGTPTTVDVWLDLTYNRDGSSAVCIEPPGDPYTLTSWNAYIVNIAAKNGTVEFSSFANHVSPFTTGLIDAGVDFASNGTEMAAGDGGVYAQWAGKTRLFTVTVTVKTGTPSLEIAPSGSQSRYQPTVIGTPGCYGYDFDNTYKLGLDWNDVDGIGPAEQFPAGIAVGGASAPAALVRPNPLNPSGELRFMVTKPGRVRAELYDAAGRMVRVLGDRQVTTGGSYAFAIDGRNHEGALLASGIYQVRLSTPDGIRLRKLAVIR